MRMLPPRAIRQRVWLKRLKQGAIKEAGQARHAVSHFEVEVADVREASDEEKQLGNMKKMCQGQLLTPVPDAKFSGHCPNH
jgi:hypothetical protein